MAWIWRDSVYPGAPKSNSVLIVQEALRQAVGLDYSSGPGIFGPATQAAYKRWQEALGYSGADADGKPGPKSLNALASRYGFEIRDAVTPSLPSSPVPGHGVTYAYGIKNSRYAAGYHTGDDYAASTGTPVVAVRSGVIQWSNGSGGAYGNWIGLKADNGRVYVYCHLSSRSVSAGQAVSAGQQLGRVGATGNVTGPHLHFEDHPAGGFVYGQCRKPSW